MSPTSTFYSRDLFTIEDIIYLLKKFYSMKDTELLNYYVKPFSSETLGYAGLHQLLVIKVIREKKKEEVLTFFVKTLQHTGNSFHQMITREELKFYGDVIQRLLDGFQGVPWGANCYLIKNNSLVLEDLRSQGFKSVGRLTDEQLKSAITTIARFHVSSILLERKMKKPLNQVFPGFFKQKMFIDDGEFNRKFMLAGMEVTITVAAKLGFKLKYILKAYEAMMKTTELRNNDRNVLCHSDLWSNNFVIDENDGCRLVDFQMVVYGSYVIDLLQLIYLNTHQKQRLRMERELLKLYQSELCINLKMHNYKGKFIELPEVIRHFKERRIYGLVAAAQICPIILLNKEMTNEFTKNDEKWREYMYTSRKDFVMRNMEIDKDYKRSIEEVVTEIIDYMKY